VSKVCQVMGLSRDTFYRYKPTVEDGGVEACNFYVTFWRFAFEFSTRTCDKSWRTPFEPADQ